MSYTNNIYIPYIEGFHSIENFSFYKKYYNDIGFNVKSFGKLKNNNLNYLEIIKNLLIDEEEEIFIIVDYLILPKFVLHQAIELSKKYKCLIKPTNKIYILNDEKDKNKVTDCLINDKILDNFNYSENIQYDLWPLDGAWIFHKESIDILFNKVNFNINEPAAFDFDITYKNALFNHLIFIKSDAYKIYPNNINIDINILFAYKSYLQSLFNLFGIPENIYLYNNQILDKIDFCEIQDYIFNVEKYCKKQRYI